MKNLYTVTQVDPGVYNISENITDRPIKFSQQLVVGKKRVAMIDAGFGIDRDLLKEIRKITQLPIICLLTHGDPDHTGGAELFDQVYMKIMRIGHRNEYRNETTATIADHRMIISMSVTHLMTMNSNMNHGHPMIEKLNAIHDMNTTNVQPSIRSLHIRKLVPSGRVKKSNGNGRQSANQNQQKKKGPAS